jgi:DNA-binding XRE family transcriptional regulator
MTDLEVLRQAHILLGQYGFTDEQEALAKAIRIISATARRLGVVANDRPVIGREAPGDRLKRLRERAGLTRAQFAEACGVMTGTVRSHENSQTPISLEAADAYSAALGTSPTLILTGRD